MRPSLILTMIVCLSAGCKHFAGNDECAPPCPNKPVPCPEEKTVTCPAPEVQVCPPKELHVKAPPAKVVVDVRAPAPVPQSAPVTQSAPAPQPAPVTQSAPATMAVPQTVMMMAAPQAATGNTTQTVRPARTRFALGWSTVNLPIPILRFVPYTTPAEVTTTTEMASVQQSAFIMQPTMALQSAQMMAQPMSMAAPQYVVTQPQTMAAPRPQTLAAPAPQDPCPPVTQELIDQLQQQLDRSRALLKAKAAPQTNDSKPEKKAGEWTQGDPSKAN